MSDALSRPELLDLVAQIVSAHAVSSEELPSIIRSVYAALAGAGADVATSSSGGRQPAVPTKMSVFPDYLICLEDGKKLRMLKRHLATAYGMTPRQYRQRWGLPDNYPMVAPDYAARRSALARKSGLGRKPAASGEASSPSIHRVPEGMTGKRAARKGLLGT